MNKLQLVHEDVKSVADDLHIKLTEEKIKYVLDNVDDYAKDDPTGDWRLWIEALLYHYEDLKKANFL
jgi:pyruvate-formate lyase-activating enzyme